VGDDHRGERVDLAVKGQLAPAEDDHHQHIDLVVAVRLDAIAPVEPDQVGLQVLPLQPPQRPWMTPARGKAGQVDRRDGVRLVAVILLGATWTLAQRVAIGGASVQDDALLAVAVAGLAAASLVAARIVVVVVVGRLRRRTARDGQGRRP
jgi:hypothetical protein